MSELYPAELTGCEKKPDFIVVIPTDGDLPVHIRWSEVISVLENTADQNEPFYILALSDGREIVVKTTYSFPQIADRLKD